MVEVGKALSLAPLKKKRKRKKSRGRKFKRLRFTEDEYDDIARFEFQNALDQRSIRGWTFCVCDAPVIAAADNFQDSVRLSFYFGWLFNHLKTLSLHADNLLNFQQICRDSLQNQNVSQMLTLIGLKFRGYAIVSISVDSRG